VLHLKNDAADAVTTNCELRSETVTALTLQHSAHSSATAVTRTAADAAVTVTAALEENVF